MVCWSGRFHKGSSQLRWANTDRSWSIKFCRTCKDLGLGPQDRRPICFWVVNGHQIPAKTNIRPAASWVPGSLWTPITQTRHMWCTLTYSAHTSHSELHYSKSAEWTYDDYDIMQGLTNCPVKTYQFRLESNTLEKSIWVVEQDEFSVRQNHVSSLREKSEMQ